MSEADLNSIVRAPPLDLDVLASADDVVRYLRQHDDIVIGGDKGIYLVNGRFHETLEQLVQRANRIRARRKLASFVLASTE